MQLETSSDSVPRLSVGYVRFVFDLTLLVDVGIAILVVAILVGT